VRLLTDMDVLVKSPLWFPLFLRRESEKPPLDKRAHCGNSVKEGMTSSLLADASWGRKGHNMYGLVIRNGTIVDGQERQRLTAISQSQTGKWPRSWRDILLLA
jgi:hypothetical protein